jgi:hypothetical protein
MTGAVAAGLAVLALVDGACAGFRSSAGRTGLIRHRQADYLAARRGAVLAFVALVPVIAVTVGAVELHPGRLPAYTRAGEAMLAVYTPYGVIVVVALACYVTLGWRQRYLASAVILGPLTLLRPAVALAGAGLGAAVAGDAVAAACAVAAALAVLTVEPLAGRLWYARQARP